jgi:hypothetical protein
MTPARPTYWADATLDDLDRQTLDGLGLDDLDEWGDRAVDLDEQPTRVVDLDDVLALIRSMT